MDLDKLKDKLYKPGVDFDERLESPETFQSEEKRQKNQPYDWQEREKRKMSSNKKYLLIAGVAVLFIFSCVVGFFFWSGLISFDKDKVEIEISGPERVVSGDEVKYIVKYKNRTKLDLDNIKLVFHYPENTILVDSLDMNQTIDLPDLGVEQENEIELPVSIVGLKGETKKAWAELSYQPSGISSRYTNQTEFYTEIVSVPLILDFDLPERLVNGQSFNFSLVYSNQADVSFDDMWVQIDYPIGFTFESSDPESSEEYRAWFLGRLMPDEQGKVIIKGSIQGENGDYKSFNARLGLFKDNKFTAYAETTDALQISISPLSVSQTVNDSFDYTAKAGELLKYKIDYENTTEVGIRDVVITSKLEGSALDLKSLSLGGGSFNGVTQVITWRGSNLSDLEYLEPNEKGQITFSVRIKKPLPVNTYTDKNFIVKNTVKIDSSDRPLSLEHIEIAGQSELITKILSDLTLQAKAYYHDDLIYNSGPIPPKVGQITTYTIKWEIVNVSNDLEDTRVEAVLPLNVQWMNKISPSNVNLDYNASTGKVVWNIGFLSAGTGIISPVKLAAFQVSITPSVTDIGSLMELIGRSNVYAQDSFIGQELTGTDNGIDTDLPDDSTVSQMNGYVVE